MPAPVPASLAERYDIGPIHPILGTPCWIWNGALDGGYGRITVDGVRWQAHRYMYELLRGRIPPGYVLDHLCHTLLRRTCKDTDQCPHRRCVNPDHMQAVTTKANNRRGNAGKKIGGRINTSTKIRRRRPVR